MKREEPDKRTVKPIAKPAKPETIRNEFKGPKESRQMRREK
jgi:hypothetical protein